VPQEVDRLLCKLNALSISPANQNNNNNNNNNNSNNNNNLWPWKLLLSSVTFKVLMTQPGTKGSLL
jgi:hypothetical protein